MKFIKTDIAGLYLLEPKVFRDDRGYFMESFNAKNFTDEGFTVNWVQDNEAKSCKGVLRGMHYQIGPFAQAKLVRVIQGKVLDVVVDIRPRSETFGKSFSIELSEENKRQMLIPRGFAHGYVCLSDNAIFAYKCDNIYSQPHEYGFSYKSVDIDWQLPESEFIISEKDLAQPLFKDHHPYV